MHIGQFVNMHFDVEFVPCESIETGMVIGTNHFGYANTDV